MYVLFIYWLGNSCWRRNRFPCYDLVALKRAVLRSRSVDRPDDAFLCFSGASLLGCRRRCLFRLGRSGLLCCCRGRFGLLRLVGGGGLGLDDLLRRFVCLGLLDGLVCLGRRFSLLAGDCGCRFLGLLRRRLFGCCSARLLDCSGRFLGGCRRCRLARLLLRLCSRRCFRLLVLFLGLFDGCGTETEAAGRAGALGLLEGVAFDSVAQRHLQVLIDDVFVVADLEVLQDILEDGLSRRTTPFLQRRQRHADHLTVFRMICRRLLLG